MIAFEHIRVSDHAMWRAAERFPHFDVIQIEDEVRTALMAGRVSYQKPDTMRNVVNTGSFYRGFYVWTASGDRVYGVVPHRHNAFELVVATTMIGGV